jgi:hypothetical protein
MADFFRFFPNAPKQVPTKITEHSPYKPAMSVSDPSTRRPFKDIDFSIAVDISTSTQGLVLATELRAISQLLALDQAFGTDNPKMTVLPWNHTTSKPIHPASQLEELLLLQSSSGTGPSSLWENNHYSNILKTSNAWFLFTDGYIAAEEVAKFARATKRQGLHGIPCIVVIFGYGILKGLLRRISQLVLL